MVKRFMGCIIVAAIVAVALFAGCLEEEAPTPSLLIPEEPESIMAVYRVVGFEGAWAGVDVYYENLRPWTKYRFFLLDYNVSVSDEDLKYGAACEGVYPTHDIHHAICSDGDEPWDIEGKTLPVEPNGYLTLFGFGDFGIARMYPDHMYEVELCKIVDGTSIHLDSIKMLGRDIPEEP
jgi:hypothetical protein